MIRARAFLMAAVAAATLVAGAAHAAEGKVKGKVVDGKGAGIGDAVVTLQDTSSGRKFELKTNGSGKFYQRGLPPGRYTLTFAKEGFRSHIVEDTVVQAGVERNFDIALRTQEELQAQARQEKLGEAYGAGFEAFQAGDFETALGKAEEALAKNPDDPKAVDMKAKALVGLKRYDEAIPLLERETGMEGAAPDVKDVLAGSYYNAGVVASREDRWDEAIRLWEKSQELGYADAKVDDYLGRAYLQRQEFARARTHLEAYLEKQPQAADAAEVRTLLEAIQKLESTAATGN